MEIINATIHYIEKKEDSSETLLHASDNPLTPDDALGFLLNRVINVFNQKPEKRFGRLDLEAAISKFPANLQGYLSEECAFVELGQGLSEEIKDIFSESKFAGNVYVLTLHYKQNLSDYYLLAMLNVTDAVSVTEALDLIFQKPLDISNFQLALRINLSEWKNNDKSQHYISYAKGRMNAKLVEDLVSFFGFQQGADPEEDTRALLKAVEAFCDNESLDSEASQALKKNTVAYCNDQSKSGEPVFVHELSGQMSEDDPDRFLAFASDAIPELATEFHPDRKSLRRLIRYSGSDKLMSISFVSEIMGDQITYDENQDVLTIKGLPPSLRAQLKGELE